MGKSTQKESAQKESAQKESAVEEPEKIDYELKRSKRKTVSISVTKDLKVTVKAPLKVGHEKIDHIVNKHRGWIEKHIKIMEESNKCPLLSKEEYQECVEKAKVLLPERVEHFSKIMNVNPIGIKITSAEKRWGSCSNKSSLCFSYTLAMLPIELVDLIVVHELTHLLVLDHSSKFYEKLEKYMPDYKQRNKALLELHRSLPKRKK